MGKTLYLECKSGISGDMLVGALLDLAGSKAEARLREALGSLPVDGFEVCVTRKLVRGIDVCDFDVVLDEEHENHDHDMAWLFGEDGGEAHHHDHGHHHDHEHHRDHDHDHAHGHHHHHHEHRTPADVEAIIRASTLSPRAKATASRVFAILAEAEAKAHGVPVDQVHYHEVGAVDSIVDVLSAAFLLDELDITQTIVSPLAEGEGEIRCAHGLLPVPVPAVANIVAAHSLVLVRTGRKGEFVTPTGAAIAAAIRTADELPAAYRMCAIGVGSGKRAYDPPSILRAMIVEDASVAQAPSAAWQPERPHLWKLETEVDDCTGEALGHVITRLYAAGANEVHFLPVTMKKGRPGVQLEVLCGEARIPELERIIFDDTTTIGIRRSPLWRTALPREQVVVETCFGAVMAKRVTLPEGVVRAYPEHESIAALAESCHVPYQDVYRAAVAALED